MKKFFKILGRLFTFIGITIGMLLVILYSTFLLICYGPSKNARNVFVTTLLETGALKFIVGLVVSDKTVTEIQKENSLAEMKEYVNSELIDVKKSDEIEVIEIAGDGFMGKLMIVHDPSRVKVATTYPFSEYGKTLDKIASENDAVAAINGGLYVSTGNKGGYPMGIVVSDGKVVWNKYYGSGYHLIGFDENNILRIESLAGKSASQIEELVKDEKIRDAVVFQEEASDANNHFVKLIINGERREVKGLGGGQNPRTAIGQREDGSVLFLVTDGRGKNGHLGANAKNLIDVMEEYGAVNAANLDGGSSSVMYYNNEYLMASVTFYFTNSSWNLPDAFIVTK